MDRMTNDYARQLIFPGIGEDERRKLLNTDHRFPEEYGCHE